MSPIIHGRIIPETYSSGLVRREHRILIDPGCVTQQALTDLLAIDVLRQYLHSLPHQPCHIVLLAPAQRGNELKAQYELLNLIRGEVLTFGSLVTPEVNAALGADVPLETLALASTAVAADADFVLTSAPDGVDLQEIGRELHVEFGDWDAVKRGCEIFVRGHEVPWSFKLAMWNCSWTPFYSMAEPDTKLVALWQGAQSGNINPETVELLRSLALNRHAALSYTRDKLLFYRDQMRWAQRHHLKRQDFAFEAGYYLNHYYVLLSAGLDQVNWIVNSLFGLGFEAKHWRKVATRHPAFLARLRQRTPQVADVYEGEDFVRWVKMLAGARNFVAHEGLVMPSEMYVRPERMPTNAELDAEIDASAEWRELTKTMPRELLELHRPTLRHETLLRHCNKVPARVMKIRVDGEEVLIQPLLNIEWDYEHFFGFAHSVAELAMEQLKRRVHETTA